MKDKNQYTYDEYDDDYYYDEEELDVDEIVNSKMDKNEAKYPIEKAKGNAIKYDEF